MPIVSKLQRLIDRSWIKSGYLGKSTLLHIAICAVPMLSLGAVADLIEPYSRTASSILLITGIAACIALRIWIGVRGMAGQGYFSSRRSERFIKRCKAGREGERASPDMETVEMAQD